MTTQVTLCWAPAAADRPAMDEVRRALDGCDGLLDGRTYTSVRDSKPEARLKPSPYLAFRPFVLPVV